MPYRQGQDMASGQLPRFTVPVSTNRPGSKPWYSCRLHRRSEKWLFEESGKALAPVPLAVLRGRLMLETAGFSLGPVVAPQPPARFRLPGELTALGSPFATCDGTVANRLAFGAPWNRTAIAAAQPGTARAAKLPAPLAQGSTHAGTAA
jgi:hypothetical protein